MKRDKSYYYILVMFLYVTCYLSCYVLSSRVIQFGGLLATAGALVYPLTYFLAVLFYERYGKNQAFELVNFAIFSLVFMGILFAFASTFDVYSGVDGMEKLLNTDFRVLFSSIVGFVVGQYVLVKLYDFLGEKKGFDFLIAGVIAITIDSFLFIFLGYIGSVPFKEVLSLATGQYALNVIAVIIYALCFNSVITTLIKTKPINDEILNEEKPKAVKKAATKKVTTKKAPAKKTTTKKASTKSTAKKTTTTKKTSTKTKA